MDDSGWLYGESTHLRQKFLRLQSPPLEGRALALQRGDLAAIDGPAPRVPVAALSRVPGGVGL